MISALYSALLDLSERPNTGESCQANAATQGNADEVKEKATDNKPAIIVSNATESKKMSSDLALALAEALCGIDEDNKHTGQIETLLNFVRERVALRIESSYLPEVENMRCVIEMHADEVAFAETGRLALKVRNRLRFFIFLKILFAFTPKKTIVRRGAKNLFLICVFISYFLFYMTLWLRRLEHFDELKLGLAPLIIICMKDYFFNIWKF